MSHEFDGLDPTEKAGIEAALIRVDVPEGRFGGD
jgi:hypothetical protein